MHATLLSMVASVCASGSRSAAGALRRPHPPSSSSTTASCTRLRPRLAPPQPPQPPYAHARAFSSSSHLGLRQDHYAVLKLPRNASKQQIKARFYELSKKHHPDAPDGGDPEQFHKINDAYSVLGDTAARSQYDQTEYGPRQRQHGHLHASPSFHPHSPQARGAAQGPHRAWGGRPPPGAHYTGPKRKYANLGEGMGLGSGLGPQTGKWGRKGDYTSGAAFRRSMEGHRLDEEVKGESIVWRSVVVFFVLVLIVGLGGGFTASAEEGDGEEVVEVWRDGDEEDGESESEGGAMGRLAVDVPRGYDLD